MSGVDYDEFIWMEYSDYKTIHRVQYKLQTSTISL
jgi:hypothetical protein